MASRLFKIGFSLIIPLSSYYIYSRQYKLALIRIKRQRGALIGAIVADAACRPLHWLYKDEQMQNAIHDKNNKKIANFAFLPNNCCLYYSLPTGASSCYGDEFLITLKSIYSNNNTFNINNYKKTIYETFNGDNNPYQIALKLRKNNVYPIDGPWLHSTIIDFNKKYEINQNTNDKTGGNHKDVDGLVGALSYTIYAVGKTNTFPIDPIKEIIETLIIDLEAVDCSIFLCRILWEILHGNTYNNDLALLIYNIGLEFGNEMILNDIINIMNDCGMKYNSNTKQIDIVDVDKNKYKSQRELFSSATEFPFITNNGLYGKGCPMPGSFRSILYNLIHNYNKNNNYNYKELILNEIEGGGDNCARCIINGCIIGALNGESNIPNEWIKRTTIINQTDIKELIKNTLGHTIFGLFPVTF